MGTLLAFATVCIGVLILRRTRPDLHRAFRVPAAPVVCILGAAACLYLFFPAFMANWHWMSGWIADRHADLLRLQPPSQQAEHVSRSSIVRISRPAVAYLRARRSRAPQASARSARSGTDGVPSERMSDV